MNESGKRQENGSIIRYFKSEKTMKDFYSSLMGIPVAGATLPVVACGLIAIYERNPIIFVAAIIFGVGHIGIHLNHKKRVINSGYDKKFIKVFHCIE